jgi:hypothetical protein
MKIILFSCPFCLLVKDLQKRETDRVAITKKRAFARTFYPK